VAVDALGKIYVANNNSPSITVYAANPSGTLNEAPLATIAGSNTGLNGPTGVAVDASGKIYVANASGATLTIYAANPSGTLNEAPLATLTGLSSPVAVTVH
jgi:DNA-binding beta-propeller fold protein YncE